MKCMFAADKNLSTAAELSVQVFSRDCSVISIIVENSDSIETLNQLLYDARDHIIGRMGIPYREKGISIISIAIDASQDIISALSGKIGRLKGVSTKTAYSNVITHTEEKHD